MGEDYKTYTVGQCITRPLYPSRIHTWYVVNQYQYTTYTHRFVWTTSGTFRFSFTSPIPQSITSPLHQVHQHARARSHLSMMGLSLGNQTVHWVRHTWWVGCPGTATVGTRIFLSNCVRQDQFLQDCHVCFERLAHKFDSLSCPAQLCLSGRPSGLVHHICCFRITTILNSSYICCPSESTR